MKVHTLRQMYGYGVYYLPYNKQLQTFSNIFYQLSIPLQISEDIQLHEEFSQLLNRISYLNVTNLQAE